MRLLTTINAFNAQMSAGQPLYAIGSRLSDIHGCPDRLATIIHLLSLPDYYHTQRTNILTNNTNPYSVIGLFGGCWVVACDLPVPFLAVLLDFIS